MFITGNEVFGFAMNGETILCRFTHGQCKMVTENI